MIEVMILRLNEEISEMMELALERDLLRPYITFFVSKRASSSYLCYFYSNMAVLAFEMFCC